jgi:hypothetical protein
MFLGIFFVFILFPSCLVANTCTVSVSTPPHSEAVSLFAVVRILLVGAQEKRVISAHVHAVR